MKKLSTYLFLIFFSFSAPSLIMEEQHKITKKDKFILTIVLIIIFVGVLGLGLIGIMVSLAS